MMILRSTSGTSTVTALVIRRIGDGNGRRRSLSFCLSLSLFNRNTRGQCRPQGAAGYFSSSLIPNMAAAAPTLSAPASSSSSFVPPVTICASQALINDTITIAEKPGTSVAAVIEETISVADKKGGENDIVGEDENDEAAAAAAAEEEEDVDDDVLGRPPPPGQPRSLRFVIVGDPQPLRRHRVANNRMYNPSSGEQKRFLEKAKPYMPPQPLVGPLEATVIFRLKRPRSHYRTGKYSHLLKKDAPRFHVARTDLDNLVKLVLDSLNEHAYIDDRQIVSVKAVKEYCNEGAGSTDVALTVLEEEGQGWWGEVEGGEGGGREG